MNEFIMLPRRIAQPGAAKAFDIKLLAELTYNARIVPGTKHGEQLRRGENIETIRGLAKALRVSRRKIENHMRFLENEEYITMLPLNRGGECSTKSGTLVIVSEMAPDDETGRENFIRFPRSVLESKHAEDIIYLQLMAVIYRRARIHANTWEGHKLKKGEAIITNRGLSEKLRVSEKAIRTRVNWLRQEGYITTEPHRYGTLVFVPALAQEPAEAIAEQKKSHQKSHQKSHPAAVDFPAFEQEKAATRGAPMGAPMGRYQREGTKKDTNNAISSPAATYTGRNDDDFKALEQQYGSDQVKAARERAAQYQVFYPLNYVRKMLQRASDTIQRGATTAKTVVEQRYSQRDYSKYGTDEFTQATIESNRRLALEMGCTL